MKNVFKSILILSIAGILTGCTTQDEMSIKSIDKLEDISSEIVIDKESNEISDEIVNIDILKEDEVEIFESILIPSTLELLNAIPLQDEKYIVMRRDTYDTLSCDFEDEGEEFVFEYIDFNNTNIEKISGLVTNGYMPQEVYSSDEWVVWLEGNNSKSSWNLVAKNINADDVMILNSDKVAEEELIERIEYNVPIYPRHIIAHDDKVIYTIGEVEEAVGVTKIIIHDLNTNTTEEIELNVPSGSKYYINDLKYYNNQIYILRGTSDMSNQDVFVYDMNNSEFTQVTSNINVIDMGISDEIIAIMSVENSGTENTEYILYIYDIESDVTFKLSQSNLGFVGYPQIGVQNSKVIISTINGDLLVYNRVDNIVYSLDTIKNGLINTAKETIGEVENLFIYEVQFNEGALVIRIKGTEVSSESMRDIIFKIK